MIPIKRQLYNSLSHWNDCERQKIQSKKQLVLSSSEFLLVFLSTSNNRSKRWVSHATVVFHNYFPCILSLHNKTILQLEDLSNELIYEIFGLLSCL